MEGFIEAATVVLVMAYIGFAVWFICKRRTLLGSIGASVSFLCGGFVIIPVAVEVATFIVWAVVIAIVLAIIGAMFG